MLSKAVVAAAGGARRKTDRLPRFRIALTYLWRHGRWPNLDAPVRFTEWVQWRKLNERSMVLAAMTDKVSSKSLVELLLGRDWIIPTLWRGQAAPTRPKWATPFVIKSTHGCNQFAVVQDIEREWDAVLAQTRRWTSDVYGKWLDEWLYGASEPGLLVEPYVGTPGRLPLDYKLYVFNGVVEVIQVHLDRLKQHRWIQFDRDWNKLSHGDDCSPPKGLQEMIQAAETLGRGHDFLRIDFYDLPAGPVFGEFCLYPGSGLDPFAAPGLDERLGAAWSAARASLGHL